jgi:hypothetical protein
MGATDVGEHSEGSSMTTEPKTLAELLNIEDACAASDED